MVDEPVTLGTVTHNHFASLVGETFAAALEEDGPKVADLALAEASPRRAMDDGRQPFSLVFDGPADVNLGQQIYWLTHPELGSLGIFLVPISADADRRRYEAVFN